MSFISVPSKKATGSRNQRLILIRNCDSKNQDHYKSEWVVEHKEYGIDVAREESTPIGWERLLHLKQSTKSVYASDMVILTSYLSGA